MQQKESLEAAVYPQIPHIAMNFDEFMHLKRQERVRNHKFLICSSVLKTPTNLMFLYIVKHFVKYADDSIKRKYELIGQALHFEYHLHAYHRKSLRKVETQYIGLCFFIGT